MDYYGTVAGFRAYHTARGTDLTAFPDDDDILAGLLVTSEWLDDTWRSQFPGLKVGYRAQIREWPRQGAQDIYGYAIDPTVPPVEVENATYEGTLKQLKSPGSLVKDWTPNKYKRASVDGAVSVEYASFGSAADIQTQFLRISQILSKILTEQGDFSPLSGGAVRV